MARVKSPWGVKAGPIILVVGLAAFWGIRQADAIRHDVLTWGDQLEHSPDPVAMEMPNLPIVPPLFVNSERIGRITRIVVERAEPGMVDSVTVVANVPREHLAMLQDCHLRLRVASRDLRGYSRALRCTADTENLEPFGHLAIQGSDLRVPIMVRVEDLPCDEGDLHLGLCDHGKAELEADLRQLRQELREQARQIRTEARAAARSARDEVRAAVRSIR
jgi:hypothetical protein